jgi:predicted tellurium resistance membrane protein TerC
MMQITELLRDPQAWIGLLTLTLLEIVLGIDNLVFISILSGKLPPEQRERARKMGLGLAVITRILFLLSIGLIMKLNSDLFNIAGQGISGKDLVLIIGGGFLIAKATIEIHNKLEGEEHHGAGGAAKTMAFGAVVAQILVIDLVFSIDSVITAVGMVPYVEVMIVAVMISVAFMLAFVGKLSDFVEKHPSVKMLALAFLVLIGANLVGEGFGAHIPKGYTYFAMAFSVVVEMLNIKFRGRQKPVELRHNYPVEPGDKK